MASLQNLPLELLETVCYCLDALSILRLTQVSRLFPHILQNSSALQYKVQLEFAGLNDGQPSGSGSSGRFEMLRTYQAAWANFDSTRSTTTPVPLQGNLWELVGNVVGTYAPQSGFSFTRIPSVIRLVSHKEWTITDVPFSVHDFSMDLSQDLLLVVAVNDSSVTIRLLSLQTGRLHPRARNPSLSRKLENQDSDRSFEIRIFAEYIGVMVDSDREDNELFVWEWKTGEIKKHIRRDDITSFAFLNNRTLLVGTFSHTSSAVLPELRVVKIDGELDDMTAHFTFRLPACRKNRQYAGDLDLKIQTEPPTSWHPDDHLDEPFTTSHEDRLFVVSLKKWAMFQASEPVFMLCFLLSTLLGLMENTLDMEEHTLMWDRWGPCGTRMLRVPSLPDPWVCFVHGRRCVLQMSKTRGNILDFSPHAASQDRILDEKTVDRHRRLFKDPVTTSAPFSLLSVEVAPSSAIMLAEDGIVAVSEEEDIFGIYYI
ncbi:hypothetical protein B0H10DRAFT_2045515 [Mycena sp. CBHHK59/15]|nr:hypothetical protein B0H10DRAFT_2045515 [Mycena sp. CBHHK59/15]